MSGEKRIKGYLDKKTWTVRENANRGYSFSSLFMDMAGHEIEEHCLKRLYPRGISRAHNDGDFHIHNLYMGIVGYCSGWSIEQLLLKGFNGVPGKIESSPPRHLSTALLQIANFAGTIQNEWAGAQAFNSLDVYLAPFVRRDNLTYEQVKQQLQQFIYNMNISSRWGGQSPFTNVNFELSVPDDLRGRHVILGGKTQSGTYSDYGKEMGMLNRAFMEVMLGGDMNERIFTFPIPTYNITKDFDWDSEEAGLLFELSAKYGIPYFQNFVNSDLDPRDVRAMCCRLQLNLKELRRRVGGFFGFSDCTGSVGVVTINMPRLGFNSKNEAEFFENLGSVMNLARDSLEIKRRVVQKNIDSGLLPFTKRYLGNLGNHFSTIGLIGMNEACVNLLQRGIGTRSGSEFAASVLKFMRNKLLEFQRETGNMYNLEATPGESTAYRLAMKDKKRYRRIKTAGKEVPYYTNSTWLPVDYTDDPFEALKQQEPLQTLYTGGTIFHTFLGERITGAQCRTLVKRIAERFRIPYFTITPTFSICRNHGYLRGEHTECPECRAPAEVYSRIVGYYRPVRSWNIGKQKEFQDRVEYRPRQESE